MISPIPPFLLKTADNSTGVDQKVFDDIKEAIKKDRYAYMTEFLKNFYGTGEFFGQAVSDEKLKADFNLGVQSGSAAFLKCVDTWLEDFRSDIEKIDIPLLIIHGDSDQILPLEATGKVLSETVGKLVVIEGGSHGIPWTHFEQINIAMIDFFQANQNVARIRSAQNGLHPDFQ